MYVHHLAILTDDVAALAEFYARVVGLCRIEAPRPGVAWFAISRTVLMIEPLLQDLRAASCRVIALGGTAWEQDALEERLRAASVAIESRTEWTVYFRDPDGNRLAFSQYDFGALPSTKVERSS